MGKQRLGVKLVLRDNSTEIYPNCFFKVGDVCDVYEIVHEVKRTVVREVDFHHARSVGYVSTNRAK